jgi:hypothetical protein
VVGTIVVVAVYMAVRPVMKSAGLFKKVEKTA